MASISIPDELHQDIESRLGDEFDTVDEYAAFALEEILNQLDHSTEATAGDREEVLDKLRDLGYLE